MIEAIQVLRDVVIIVAGLIVMMTVLVVGRVILDLAQKAEDLRVGAVEVVKAVRDPVKGLVLALRRGWREGVKR